jgi:hypothetical protein
MSAPASAPATGTALAAPLAAPLAARSAARLAAAGRGRLFESIGARARARCESPRRRLARRLSRPPAPAWPAARALPFARVCGQSVPAPRAPPHAPGPTCPAPRDRSARVRGRAGRWPRGAVAASAAPGRRRGAGARSSGSRVPKRAPRFAAVRRWEDVPLDCRARVSAVPRAIGPRYRAPLRAGGRPGGGSPFGRRAPAGAVIWPPYPRPSGARSRKAGRYQQPSDDSDGDNRTCVNVALAPDARKLYLYALRGLGSRPSWHRAPRGILQL